MTSEKYPRTPHLPFSPGATNDDRRLSNVDCLLRIPLILTEKMDGSNICLESHAVFSRSHGRSPTHPSFDQLKALHASIKHRIPPEIQIFGEWLYARHSIGYFSLPNYLLIFGVRENHLWAPWEDVTLWAEELEVPTVPILQHCCFERPDDLRAVVESYTKASSACGGEREGVVVRNSKGFSHHLFDKNVAKWVRQGHVQTNEHWKSQQIVRNGLQS